MNAIKRITIENFQSHQKSIVDLAPSGQLTVVTGPSDAGKTVIIRALRWVLLNEPQGVDFIRVGCTFARVSVQYESGHVVVRERTASGSRNQYKIVSPVANDGPIVLEGFGVAVPLEVQEITGVRPVTIGDVELNLNLAEQLDGPFLGKSVSSGTRAKVLGKLAGTEEIDYAGKELGTDLYRRNQDEKRLKAELDQLAGDVAKYDYLPAMAERIGKLEQLVETIKNNNERSNMLTYLKGMLAQTEIYIGQCNYSINRWRNIELAEAALTTSQSSHQKANTLRLISEQLCRLYSGMEQATDTLERWAGLSRAAELAENVAKLKEQRFKFKVLESDLFLQNQAIEASQAAVERHKNVEVVAEQIGSIGTMNIRRDNLVAIKTKLRNIDFSVKHFQEVCQKYVGIDAAADAVTSSTVIDSRRNKLVELSKKLACADRDIDDSRGAVVLWEQRVSQLEGAYHDALVDCGVCPTCGTVMDPLKMKLAS